MTFKKTELISTLQADWKWNMSNSGLWDPPINLHKFFENKIMNTDGDLQLYISQQLIVGQNPHDQKIDVNFDLKFPV